MAKATKAKKTAAASKPAARKLKVAKTVLKDLPSGSRGRNVKGGVACGTGKTCGCTRITL